MWSPQTLPLPYSISSLRIPVRWTSLLSVSLCLWLSISLTVLNWMSLSISDSSPFLSPSLALLLLSCYPIQRLSGYLLPQRLVCPWELGHFSKGSPGHWVIFGLASPRMTAQVLRSPQWSLWFLISPSPMYCHNCQLECAHSLCYPFFFFFQYSVNKGWMKSDHPSTTVYRLWSRLYANTMVSYTQRKRDESK